MRNSMIHDASQSYLRVSLKEGGGEGRVPGQPAHKDGAGPVQDALRSTPVPADERTTI